MIFTEFLPIVDNINAHSMPSLIVNQHWKKGLYLDNYKIDFFHCFYGSPIQIIIGLSLQQRIYINWIYIPWISKIRKRTKTIPMIFFNSYTLKFFKYKIVLFCLFWWLVALAFLFEEEVSRYFSHICNFNCFQQKCILHFSFT